jgi:hypothetical protein
MTHELLSQKLVPLPPERTQPECDLIYRFGVFAVVFIILTVIVTVLFRGSI